MYNPADMEDAINEVASIPPSELASDEEFWHYVQQSYTIAPNFINLNNGGVSPSPRIVQEAVERGHEVTVFHRGPAEPSAFPEVEHVHGDRDGGLGVLAGDHLKAANDLGLPLTGVGLFYRHGYFRQHLDRRGWQPSIPMKMFLGLVMMSASMAIMLGAAKEENRRSTWWI